MVNNKQYIGIR